MLRSFLPDEILRSAFISGRALVGFCASFCLLIALLTLSGWLLHVPVLRTFVHGGASMFPLTALGFIAVSTVLILEISPNAKNQTVTRSLATGVVFLGLLSGVFRAAEWVPSPFTLASGADATVWSVPSPTTSVLFVAIGTSLVLMLTRRSIGLAQAVAVATLLVSFLVVTGYLSRGTFLYALLPGKGTALPSAFSFILAAGGVLSLHSKEGLMRALSNSVTGRRTLYQLLVPALASPILLGIVATAVTGTESVPDVDTTIWLMVWGLLIILTIVIWRFAYRLQQQEMARALAERERKEALDALRRADERKDEFLAMLAHELRNPLAPLGAAADLLKVAYASDPDQVRRMSEVISRQVDHMVHLVNDLLDVSRVTRGIIVLQKEKLDARRLVAEALEQVLPLLNMKKHQFRVDLPNTTIPVEGDHKRLVQVLANLLNNAGKYTPEGGDLFVQLMTKGEKVVVSVKDNGIGIAPDLLPDIFEIFTQAKRTPDRAQGGLGLGLALVKRIVELHGGWVSAHSEGLGKGSVFSVVLPHALLEQSALQESGTNAITQRTSNPMSIMVVDDNIDAADTLALLLEAHGHRVTATYTSATALESVRRLQPDVCIIDIGLPGMDGNELATHIRSLTDLSAPTLIALSGYGGQHGREKASMETFDHYFIKPVVGQELAGLLEELALRKTD